MIPGKRALLSNHWNATIVLLLICVGGCSKTINQPLNASGVPLERRIHNHTLAETFTAVERPGIDAGHEIQPATGPTSVAASAPGWDTQQVTPRVHDQDGYFVGLSISGGGSRSANFGAACMFQLERIGLLQRVDYISSVSGGSLTAAYYCLNREGWNPRDVQHQLTHAFASDIWDEGLLPWNTFALIFTDFNRADMLATTLADNLFTKDGKQQTFKDLLPDRPRLLINATDMQSAHRFIFCNETFDAINSNLADFPMAYAVAASSAVPVVLHPVTLRDYSTIFPQYRHLLDGGVVDNLGVQALVETYRAQVEEAIRAGQPNPYPHGAVFIVLDARTSYDPKISSQQEPGFFESLKAASGLTTAAIVGRASEATMDDIVFRNAPDGATAKELRRDIRTLERDGYVEFKNVEGQPIRVAHIALQQLENLQDLPFSGFRESVNSINTYFNIQSDEAYDLYIAAELLMKNRFETQLTGIVKEMEKNAER